MRRMTLLLFALTLAAAPADAAPICQNRLGDWVRCEAKDAMPVGWHVPDDVYTARVLSRTPPLEQSMLIAAAALLAALLAIIALLPQFDGARDEDWDAQSGEN